MNIIGPEEVKVIQSVITQLNIHLIWGELKFELSVPGDEFVLEILENLEHVYQQKGWMEVHLTPGEKKSEGSWVLCAKFEDSAVENFMAEIARLGEQGAKEE